MRKLLFCIAAILTAALPAQAADDLLLHYGFSKVSDNGDATALKTAIAEAERCIADSATYFLSGCVENVKDEIEVAGIVAEGGYSQNYIDDIADKLATLVAAMRKSKGVEFKPYDNMVSAYDTDRGFTHPGGLHTQADFDRIKRQLAEGNETVTKAYEVLKSAEYAQPTITTYPVQTIIRGGSSGQNYINAARGATMAYQNALRWKIEGNEECAAAAVRILMSWASTCKGIGGDSNYALAAGLYGYEFAQAAELVRDKFTATQMKTMRRWFLDVWYTSAMGFLRARNGTWENTGNKPGAGWGDAGNRPGHYWSNWGLCNTLCIMSIGVFCDDVTVYNEGVSFFKYDQVGSFVDPRTASPVLNDGLTEFLGNLVVTTAATPDTLEASGYGIMGQMQESGRDVGHATMALGLAADIAHMGWNQGDDLFSYMDNRLAAGVEFTAAINCGMTKLPWRDYKYVDCRTAWHNGWYMSEPAYGSQVRPYWGTIVGHYEGVKGVKMPYAEKNLEMMGIDGGGTGSTSGGYDHLGYSVLMNTRDEQLAPADSVPTLLTPLMEYDGEQIAHNELGSLKNTFTVDNNTALPKGKTVKLMPQLPNGESDTGQWQWNTGETTKDITVTTDRSYVYRATYTNAKGVKSQQCFSLSVQGDCDTPDKLTVTASQDGVNIGSNDVTVFYGSTLTLSANAPGGYGTFLWDNGETGSTMATGQLVRERDFEVNYKNHGGAVVAGRLHVNLKYMRVQSIVNGVTKPDTTFLLVNKGDNVVIGPYVPDLYQGYTCRWSNGSTERTLTFDSIQSSGTYVLDYECNGEKGQLTYEILVPGEENADIEPGTYYIRNRYTDTYLTRFENTRENVKFCAPAGSEPDASQTWILQRSESEPAYKLMSAKDSMAVNTGTYLRPADKVRYIFYFAKAAGADYYQIHNKSSQYYEVNEETGAFATGSPASLVATNYPLELIPAGGSTGIASATTDAQAVGVEYYSLGGIRLSSPGRGVVIERKRLADGTVVTAKRVY